MTDRNGLIQLLTTALGPNPRLREALTDTLFAVMSDTEDTTDCELLSYLELLEQLARQRKDARNAGRERLEQSLQQLCRQLAHELHRSALELHRTLKAGQLPDFEHLNRVDIDLDGFPIGISPTYNLQHLSDAYLQTMRDVQALQRHGQEQLPELTRALQLEQQTNAQLLHDVAWEALSTGLFPDQVLLHFSDVCKHSIHQQRAHAEQTLLQILQGLSLQDISAITPQLETWLIRFGRPHWPVLHTAISQDIPIILHALLRMQNPIGLAAFASMPARGRDAALVFTLLTLRFGDTCPFSQEEWPSWLHQTLDSMTHYSQTVKFWQAHPYTLPAIMLDWFRKFPASQASSVKIPDAIMRKMQADTSGTTLLDLLERRRAVMTLHEIRILEGISGISMPHKTETVEATPDIPSPLSHAVEGAVDTALDAVKEGNLVEAVLVTALDKGTVGLKQQMTVLIEDEDAVREEQTQPPKIGFSQTASHPTAPTRHLQEPEMHLWEDQILPFVLENWAPLVGGSMILTGLLLLEFYIWDKAVWIRYGVSPVIIALVSLMLTFLGRRLHRKSDQFDTSLSIIQGLAVFLAPLSLLFVTLFFVDSDLSLANRILGGVVLSALLLAAWSTVFALSMSIIYRNLVRLYSGTLLLINGLLLLLSVTRLMVSGGHWLTSGTKAVLVFGFYLGFGVMSWSLRTAFKNILSDTDEDTRTPMSFYSMTCLGTFALVWGLTHAYLRVLPQAFTYGPLLLLLSFLIMRVEFMLLDHQHKSGRITSLSYTAYFLISLGLLLSIGHDYVRVCALLLAGGGWMYQAYKLRRIPTPPGLKFRYSLRHENIALVLLLLGFSLIAMIPDFPPTWFPFLALGIALSLYALSEKTALFSENPFVAGLIPVYLALAFALSIIWQWSQHLDPVGYGVAFLLFGAFTLYLGATSQKLIHVHAGTGYCVAALPYLGMMDMELFTLEGNTLVFGLAIVGVVWTAVSSLTPIQPFKESRSTVLWNIGILALCLMCLRLFLQETLDFSSASLLLQVQILSAPIIIGALMLLVGYFTNSYPAIYLSLVIFIFIFPEIKDQLLKYPGVQTLVSTGLGTSLTGLGLILLVYGLQFWQPLRQEKSHDLIWRQKMFPFQAGNGYVLFAHPLMVAAVFLLSRNLFYRYPAKAFFPPYDVHIATCLAVVLAGIGYLAFSLWYRRSWFSYLGFLAIIFGCLHSGILNWGVVFSPPMMPVLLLMAFVYGEIICVLVSRAFKERSLYIAKPFGHLKIFFLWLLAFTAFLLYALLHSEGIGLLHWLPIMLYFCGVAGRITWRTDRLWYAWLILIPGYLLLWQTVLMVVFGGKWGKAFFNAPEIPLHLATAGTVLAIVLGFFFVEWRASIKRFRILSPTLWISFIFLCIWSLVAAGSFYDRPLHFMPQPFIIWNFALWAIVSVLLGRFLSIAPLWLWALFLLHFPVLLRNDYYTEFYWLLPPVILAAIAGILGIFTVFCRKFHALYQSSYSWPWSRIEFNSPSVVFALVSQLFVVVTFWQAVLPPVYQSTFFAIATFWQSVMPSVYPSPWLIVAGLFLATLPALLVAPSLKLSRRVLFSLPYIGAWIGLAVAVQTEFSPQLWLPDFSSQLLLACGIFGAISTLILSEYLRPSSNATYMTIKYVGMLSVPVCVIIAYLSVRNIQLLSWQWLTASLVLLFGSAVFFRRYAKL